MDNQVVNTGEALEIHEKILDLKKIMSTSFLILGKYLKTMKENKHWQVIVGEGLTWSDYCAEISINRSYATVLISIYDRFVVQFGIPELEVAQVDQRKLIAMLPVATTRATAILLLEEAKYLTREDLLKRAHQMKNNPETCKHTPTLVRYFYCPNCKEKLTDLEAVQYGYTG